MGERLKVFEGIPAPYDTMKRVVVPDALRVLRLKSGRRFAVLKELSTLVGWRYGDVVERLEEKRKVASAAFMRRRRLRSACRPRLPRASRPGWARSTRSSRPSATE